MAVWLDLKPDKVYYLLLVGTMYTRLTPEGPENVKDWDLHIYESNKSRHRQMVVLLRETMYRDFLILDLTAKELFQRAKLAHAIVRDSTVVHHIEDFKKPR